MNKEQVYSIFILGTLTLLSIVDNGLPGIYFELAEVFKVKKEVLVELISLCSLGIVCGMLIFPIFINNERFVKMNFLVLFLSLISISFLFFEKYSMTTANIARFFLGGAIGSCSSLAWWYSFNRAKDFKAYNTWIMSSRPISVAVGVLMFVVIKKHLTWDVTYISLTLVGPIFLFISTLSLPKLSKTKRNELKFKNPLSIYKQIFSNSKSFWFYSSLLFNSMGYLGFFVLVPFTGKKYLNLESFFIILGTAEICGTLLSRNVDLKKKGYMLLVNLILVIIPFTLFIFENSNLVVFLLPVYILAVRIYIVDIANLIPTIFSFLPSKDYLATCGSLIGVFAWVGLGIISYAFSSFSISNNLSEAYLILFMLNLASIITLYKLRTGNKQ